MESIIDDHGRVWRFQDDGEYSIDLDAPTLQVPVDRAQTLALTIDGDLYDVITGEIGMEGPFKEVIDARGLERRRFILLHENGILYNLFIAAEGKVKLVSTLTEVEKIVCQSNRGHPDEGLLFVTRRGKIEVTHIEDQLDMKSGDPPGDFYTYENVVSYSEVSNYRSYVFNNYLGKPDVSLLDGVRTIPFHKNNAVYLPPGNENLISIIELIVPDVISDVGEVIDYNIELENDQYPLMKSRNQYMVLILDSQPVIKLPYGDIFLDELEEVQPWIGFITINGENLLLNKSGNLYRIEVDESITQTEKPSYIIQLADIPAYIFGKPRKLKSARSRQFVSLRQ